jgi:hypothetical protein
MIKNIKSSLYMKERWKDPKFRQRMSDIRKGKVPWNKGISFLTREKNPNWKGGVAVENHKRYSRSHNITYYRRLRVAGLELLGGKCVRCGFSDIRALQFDHIHGGGCKDKRERKAIIYKDVIDTTLRGENKYQLLCANCNWIKRCENNEVRNGSRL